MSFGAGTIVGERYLLVKPLGSGGMATVYRAQSVSDPSFQVALKVFHPGIIRSAEAKDRYRTEILAAYRVPHENVIQVYEFFDEGDLFAFAMEYADNGDLFARLERGLVPEGEVLDIMYQVAAGLSAIHDADVVHRDLKPENIMMTKEGRVKISDFGVARMAGIQTPTQSGHIVGTPRYVSPEYVVTGNCDKRSDIFALGFIAFEMLTKKPPFPEHTGEVLSRRRYDPAQRTLISQCYADCSDELELIIERSLALSLTRRYQSAEQICEDIDRLWNREPLSKETLDFAKRRQAFFSGADWRALSKSYYAFGRQNETKSLSIVSWLNLLLCICLIILLAIQ